uniref:Translation initiation factor IF-2-like n=1 Tax=Ciona intestinalis TaxID=7719 RepID=F6YS75_CIOIN|nr:uncharacterized protein LOC100186360 isoform X1 [Ciona intestinalis]|eukprot:XP_002122955.1 uncharacterized protein LOC100186360 isoform X1 [Ciona intestinalis]
MYRPVPQQQPLPAGWEAKYDAGSNRWFFLNHQTKTTQWTDPRLSMQQPSPYIQPMRPHQPQVTTTSFIEADTSKVNALKKSFAADEELLKSLLRTHQNDMGAVEKKLKEMGYIKKETVVPNEHQVKYLHQQYPSAPIQVVRQVLGESKNSVPGARVTLDVMGFKRYDVEAKNVQANKRKADAEKLARQKAELKSKVAAAQKKKQLSHDDKLKIKQQLKSKFPTVDSDSIDLCLGSTNYDIPMATNILENQIKNEKKKKKEQERRRREEEEERERRVIEEQERENSARNMKPAVFGEDETEPSQPSSSDAQPSVSTTVSPSQPKAVPVKKTPKKTLPSKQNKVKKTVVKTAVPKKAFTESYRSHLRILPMGHNPTLCKGHNPALLITTYTERVGANKENQVGPQESNRKGPQPQHRVGALGTNYRSS